MRAWQVRILLVVLSAAVQDGTPLEEELTGSVLGELHFILTPLIKLSP